MANEFKDGMGNKLPTPQEWLDRWWWTTSKDNLSCTDIIPHPDGISSHTVRGNCKIINPDLVIWTDNCADSGFQCEPGHPVSIDMIGIIEDINLDELIVELEK